ncbi:hypothetical protein D3C85_457050 [compost metagenome]
MTVFKLDNRKVVVSEKGVSKVLTSPCGVSYSEKTERFYAWVINDQDQWSSRSFGINVHGAINAFELAVEAREDSLNFLLNRRMLPRIRHLMRKVPDHATTIRQVGDFYIVRDPLRKNYHKFATKEDAQTFNIAVTEEWKLEYKFDKLSMIKIDNQPYKRTDVVDSFTRQFRNAAQEIGIRH